MRMVFPKPNIKEWLESSGLQNKPILMISLYLPSDFIGESTPVCASFTKSMPGHCGEFVDPIDFWLSVQMTFLESCYKDSRFEKCVGDAELCEAKTQNLETKIAQKMRTCKYDWKFPWANVTRLQAYKVLQTRNDYSCVGDAANGLDAYNKNGFKEEWLIQSNLGEKNEYFRFYSPGRGCACMSGTRYPGLD